MLSYNTHNIDNIYGAIFAYIIILFYILLLYDLTPSNTRPYSMTHSHNERLLFRNDLRDFVYLIIVNR